MSELRLDAGAADAYEADYHAWALRQAALLRNGRLSDLDAAHLAEEIEDLGRRQRDELESHLEVLLLHLLKWEFQPERRGRSWELTIVEQRERIARLLLKSPSLRAHRDAALTGAYRFALRRTARETGLPQDFFPWGCKYGFSELTDPAFWPDLD